MTVRPARSNDLDDVLSLYAALHEPHRERYPELFNDPLPAHDRQALERDVASERDDVLVLVAEAEGELVGFARVLLVQTPEGRPLRSRRFALVDDLVVASEYRRRGMAAELLAATEAWARSRDVESLEVTVWSFNDPAKELYRRRGFEPFREYLRKPLRE